MYWKIGDLAKLANISVRTLHHYEDIGLLVAVERTASGYRLYDEHNLRRLMQILCLSQIGLSLNEIEIALHHYPDGILKHLKLQSIELSQRIEDLKALEQRLNHIVQKISQNQSPSWQDWQINDELIQLHDQYFPKDPLEVVTLYDRYLSQSPHWQALQQTSNAWQIWTSLEDLIDYNIESYTHIFSMGMNESFGDLKQQQISEIFQQWRAEHHSLWQKDLPIAASTILQQTHDHLYPKWLDVLQGLHDFFSQQIIENDAYEIWQDLWCQLGQNDRNNIKQLMQSFFKEPLLQKGFCLNHMHLSICHKWFNQFLQSNEHEGNNHEYSH